MPRPIFRLTTAPAATVVAGHVRVTPIARSLQVRLPDPIAVGVSWWWPATVEVEQDDGSVTILPVLDVTRRVQMWLLLSAVLVALAACALRRARHHSGGLGKARPVVRSR